MIEVGERAPDFALPTVGDRATRFYGQVGGSISLLVLAGDDADGGADLADRLRSQLDVDVALVTCSAPSDGAAAYRDPEAGVHGAYDIDPDGGTVVMVLDPNVRVAATHGPEAASTIDPEDVASSVQALADDRAGRTVQRHAPVLLVPGAISDEVCDRVIARWEAADPVETGVETMADGRHVEALDHLRKRRRDHVITDPEFQRLLTSHIGRRVIPELQKAFAYDASAFEGFKIGCYTEEDEGFFAPHRDNLSAATAHRRFAVSVNLNPPDEYDGGGLRFPEYGPDVYRPDRGEALVFSGSHLHEVQPVTRGRRFVLLSFLFAR